jgi:nucleolar protein 14
MAKRKTFSKKSIQRLPKGLPIRATNAKVVKQKPNGNRNAAGTMKGQNGSSLAVTGLNPFEMTHQMKRPKFAVHNRTTTTASSNNFGSTSTTVSSIQKNLPYIQGRMSALAESLVRRQKAIVTTLQQSNKSNQFIDQRIGELSSSTNHRRSALSQQQLQQQQQNLMTNDAKNLARLVRERTRQSKRISKFALDQNEEGDDTDIGSSDKRNKTKKKTLVLTHKGTAIRDMTDVDHVMLSDNDDDDDDDDNNDGGDLDAYDTEMHFGGRGITNNKNNKSSSINSATYGGSTTNTNADLSNAYTQRKLELDDLIVRRKTMKLERIKAREAQVNTFEQMDTTFQELASMLTFRDKEQEIRQRVQEKRTQQLSQEDQELDDWDREMKQYIHIDRKQKLPASDRTKTVEELAQEEANLLHTLETQRLARMNGDFDDDDEDVDDTKVNNGSAGQNKKRKVTNSSNDTSNRDRNPEELLDYDNDDDRSVSATKFATTTRFTSEGLVYVNQDGVILGKVGDTTTATASTTLLRQGTKNESDIDDKEGDDEDEVEEDGNVREYNVGDKVTANYRAEEQYDGHEAWYNGVITKVMVNNSDDGTAIRFYDIEFDDGDTESNVKPQYIRPMDKTSDDDDDDNDLEGANAAQTESSDDGSDNVLELKRKRQRIIEKARYVILFRMSYCPWFNTLRTRRVHMLF